MKNYQKVYALGHKYIQGIFDGDVLIEEKIDGSQINFSKSIEDGTINIENVVNVNLVESK